eukprot:gene18473-214_t
MADEAPPAVADVPPPAPSPKKSAKKSGKKSGKKASAKKPAKKASKKASKNVNRPDAADEQHAAPPLAAPQQQVEGQEPPVGTRPGPQQQQ